MIEVCKKYIDYWKLNIFYAQPFELIKVTLIFSPQKGITNWIKAECKRRVELKRTFYDIDAFYKLNEDNFEDFCSSPQGAEAVLETKLKNLANALRTTDNVATEMFEDLSRTPNVIPQVSIIMTLVVGEQLEIFWLPYPRHYKPRLVFFLPHFLVRFIIKRG